MSEREESPDGDNERDKACETADLTDSPEGAEGLDSWAEDEEGEERGSDCWVLGFQACSLFRATEAAHGDIAAKFVASSCSLLDGSAGAGEIIPTTGTCSTALLSSADNFMTRPGTGGARPPAEASSTSIAATSSPEDVRSFSLVLLPLVCAARLPMSLPLRLCEIWPSPHGFPNAKPSRRFFISRRIPSRTASMAMKPPVRPTPAEQCKRTGRSPRACFMMPVSESIASRLGLLVPLSLLRLPLPLGLTSRLLRKLGRRGRTAPIIARPRQSSRQGPSHDSRVSTLRSISDSTSWMSSSTPRVSLGTLRSGQSRYWNWTMRRDDRCGKLV